MRRWSWAVAVLAAGLLVSGCGAGNGTAPQAETPGSHSPGAAASTSPPAPRPTTTSASPEDTPPPSSTAPTRADSVTPTTLPSDVTDLSSKSLAEVVSPSRHIACLFVRSDPSGPSVRCDVIGAHWGVRPPPHCPGVYGDSAVLRDGRARLLCHGDTVFDPDIRHALGYGHRAVYRGLTCTSRRTGMTCADRAGHGFTVSREDYRLF